MMSKSEMFECELFGQWQSFEIGIILRSDKSVQNKVLGKKSFKIFEFNMKRVNKVQRIPPAQEPC